MHEKNRKRDLFKGLHEIVLEKDHNTMGDGITSGYAQEVVQPRVSNETEPVNSQTLLDKANKIRATVIDDLKAKIFNFSRPIGGMVDKNYGNNQYLQEKTERARAADPYRKLALSRRITHQSEFNSRKYSAIASEK